MKPDLLVCWIRHCDYPLFRKYLRKHRQFFGKIVIYWSEHFRQWYFDKFIEEDLRGLGNIEFLPSVEYEYGVADWRNVATHEMLKRTDSEWICSVEQDFFVRDWDKLFADITEASKTYDLLGYRWTDGHLPSKQYVHPAFWFMRRSTLEKTTQNFAADIVKGADHFGLITQDAEVLNIPIWYMQDYGWKDFTDAYHQGGINVTYLNALDDPSFEFHQWELFYLYNHFSLKADVPQDPLFMEIMQKMEERLRLKFPEFNPEADPRKVFYE